MEIKKAMNAAMAPIVAIVVLDILQILIQFVPVIGVIACLILPVMLVLFGAIGWYCKKAGIDMASAVAVAALVEFVLGVLNTIVSIVFMYLGIGATAAALSQTGTLVSAMGAGAVVILLVSGIVGAVIFAVIAAVVAAIGYYIAGMTKK